MRVAGENVISRKKYVEDIESKEKSAMNKVSDFTEIQSIRRNLEELEVISNEIEQYG